MKHFAILLFLLSMSAAPLAHAGREGNGGDMCEDRIKQIRDDIMTWIVGGGPNNLKFPAGVTLDQYKSSMTKALMNAQIGCTDGTITIQNKQKTCENFYDSSNQPQILCNEKNFMDNTITSESNQYVLIHHEFAGLAGIETNNDDGSNYILSNQITGYLEEQEVLKLAINPDPNAPGEIQIDSITGASRVNKNPNGSAMTIYGGMASSPGSQHCTGTSTCNTCVGNIPLDRTFTGCNEAAVTPNTLLTITFRATVSGYPMAYVANVDSNDDTTPIPINNNVALEPVVAGQLVTITIPWSTICTSALGASCDQVASGTSAIISVGVSSLPAYMSGSTYFPIQVMLVPKVFGFEFTNLCTALYMFDCTFSVTAGNSSALITTFQSNDGVGPGLSAVRFYYMPVPGTPDDVPLKDFSNFNLNNLRYGQLDVGPGWSVPDAFTITGLKNGTTYIFKTAHVDSAGNIGTFTSDYFYERDFDNPKALPDYKLDTNCDSGTTCHIAQPHP